MPLNVRRFSTSVLLVFVSFIGFTVAQTIEPTPVSQPQAPTSGDVMRDRISKAKAFIVVRNYNAAIYELENIRKESADPAVQSVVSVLLMNSYLEQGDYKRAQDFLSDLYNQQKTTKPNAALNYNAVAGQIVKGAKSRAERYRALGLSVTDRTLPLEALNDLEKMRETLELLITQSKEIGKTPARTQEAMMMLEEASTSRAIIARDSYDARRWQDETANTREEIASSRSVVLSAVPQGGTETVVPTQTVATNPTPVQPTVVTPSVQTPTSTPQTIIVGQGGRDREVKTPPTKQADTTVAVNTPPKTEPTPAPTPAKSNDGSPLDVGSLVAYATRLAQPTYPPAAKSVRATGVVKVEITVDEKGEVAEIGKASGHSMLQAAAKDAIRKWRFKPFTRDGQPVRANGYVSFNFNL
ncbi:MAG: energy transducer TonB [Blastocatellia bacterium]|nr:energy transducer TonB [Blastocatellia bacterium]